MGCFWIFALINSGVISIKYMPLGTYTWDIFIGWYVGKGLFGPGGHTPLAFQKVLCVPRWLYNLSLTWKVQAGLQGSSSTRGIVSSLRFVNSVGTAQSAIVSLATSETGDLHTGGLFCDLPMRASLCRFHQMSGPHLLQAACYLSMLSSNVTLCLFSDCKSSSCSL